MDRAAYLQLWDDWWEGDIWIAPWSKAVAGLTAAQASWSPAPGRHSIWQNVSHVTFWRNYTLNVLAGKPKPPSAEVERDNFAAPSGKAATEDAWAKAREALADSHRRMRAAIADAAQPMERLKHHLPHDAYHLGQIMYVRALQGLPALV
jgi:hypothetical protein